MPLRATQKSLLPIAMSAAFALGLAGCASDAGGEAGGQAGTKPSTNIADGEYYSSAWLAAKGYDEIDPALLPQRQAPVVHSSRGVPLGGDGNKPAKVDQTSTLPAPAPVGSGAGAGPVPPLPSEVSDQREAGVWSLVLATFTDGNTIEAAQRMISETAKVAPDVQNLRVHPTSKGSMVVYGAYPGRDDAKATEDRKWLKSITYEQRPVFSSVMLAHLDLRPLQADLHPYDLHMARREHPKVDPLYTLDIAVWDDFDSGKLSYDEIRRSAERYAKQLRSQGFEAYFYHDDVAKRSMVTVGLFDRRAIHEVSGLYTDIVTELASHFPQRLANGEPQFDYSDRFRPEMGVKPLTPVLVLVPDM